MLTAALSRVLVNALGMVWPGYLCFKDLRHGKQDALQQWCKYWLVLAMFTALESVLDSVIFWVPMYYEAKVLFVLFLWHPRTKGAAYLYDTGLGPLLQEYEPSIDKAADEWKEWMASHVTNHISWVRDLVQSKAGAAVELLRQYQQQPAAGTGSGGSFGVPGEESEEIRMQYPSPRTASQAALNGLGRAPSGRAKAS